MQAATDQSVEAVRMIGRTIDQINSIATTIASAVEEQGAATKEIARNVQEASTGTNDVSYTIAEVNRSATDTRSEEHTSELQSLSSNSYAVFCLKKKKINSE